MLKRILMFSKNTTNATIPSNTTTNVCVWSWCRAITSEEQYIGAQIFYVAMVITTTGLLCFGTYHMCCKSKLYRNVADSVWWGDGDSVWWDDGDADFAPDIQMIDKRSSEDV